MTKATREQLVRIYQVGPQVASGFSTTGGTTDDISATLGVLAGNDGVPIQVATTTGVKAMGYILSANAEFPYILSIFDSTSKSALTDGNGNEIYGKLTKPAGNYILNYFSLVNGVETAYSMPAATSIDFTVNYYYNDLLLPEDFAVRVSAIQIGQDPTSRSTSFSEALTVSALNTLSALSYTPIAGKDFKLFINGLEYSSITGEVSTTGTTVNWLFNLLAGGFDIQTTGYTVKAEYLISQ